MQANKLMEKYFELKAKRKELDDTYKEKKATIDEAMSRIKMALDKVMVQAGTDQLKVAGVGVAFPEIKQKIQVTDAAELRNFVVSMINDGDDDAIMLLNAAANQANCKAWLDENETLPEGVELVQERVITVRKSK